jgi:multiple antibiotic resistance protein
MDYAYALSVFVAILAIINPVSTISFFATFTQDYSKEEKKRVALKAVVVAMVTLIIFGLIGNYIFLAFSITIPAFRIAGGILLFSIAFSMLYGKTPGTKATDKEKKESIEKEMVGVIPIGIPMISGPGAISTVMLYVSHGTVVDTGIVFASIIVTVAITYVLLVYSDIIFQRIGRTGILAISRIMGLILATIAIQFIINGIHDVTLEWATEIQVLLI